MSGAEIASFGLAVLPLLISAAEQYTTTVRPFRRWKNYNEELDRFEAKLACQEVNFQTEFQTLLNYALGWDAKDALRRFILGQLSEREKERLDAKVLEYLGENHSKVVRSEMGFIIKSLKSLDKKCHKFRSIVEPELELAASLDDKRAWLSSMMTKLKFSFSGPDLAQKLSELREHNESLNFTLNQVRRLRKSANHVIVKPTLRTGSSTDVRSKIQTAAATLYNIILDECNTHIEHYAYLDLSTFPESAMRGHVVSFDMALRPWPEIQDSTFHFPVGFTIQLAFSEQENNLGGKKIMPVLEDTDDRSCPSGSQNVRKRALETPELDSENNKRLKSDEYEKAKTSSKTSTKISLPLRHLPAPPNSASTSHRHRKREQFCEKVGMLSQEPRMQGNHYDLDNYNLLFPQRPLDYRKHISLADLMRHSRGDSISSYERVRLARQLASAVLNFHATPLLEENWASDEIVFFDLADDNIFESQALTPAHLCVHIKQNGPTRIPPEDAKDKIKNIYIFRLGYFLIELAYQRPFLDLVKDQALIDSGDFKERKFQIAKICCESMGRFLGKRYKDVAETCVTWNTNGGAPLVKFESVVEFERDVVSVLERLEKDLASCWGGESR